ncbi:MAG: DUF72 domain-containing protein [Nitrospinota bacterium]|nr:MAG: DUF72 domain-containing protein [Nitrospinota bacterium]
MKRLPELQHLPALQQQGIFFGTSSWKYEGWKGIVYCRDYKNKRDFEARCLEEYATIFPTVGIDFTFYTWPDPRVLQRYYETTPASFTMALKVTEQITVKRWPTHKRYGKLGGQENPLFLDPEAFKTQFLARVEVLREKLGPIIFEFGTFFPGVIRRGAEFVERLDRFLAAIPQGYPYAVEVRNRSFLHPDYFACLRRHRVAHLFNSWTRMPRIGEQLCHPDSITGDFLVVRALLLPGRRYEEAVQAFAPYDRIKEPSPELRADLVTVVERARAEGKRAFIYVNNRAEGSSPHTIAAVVSLLEQRGILPVRTGV